jgi:AcrR family transcriptional regulator
VTSERTAQKQRTREAILDGARRLLARGEPVTVPAAAQEHGISRATAYRHFPDAQALMLEAGLATLVPPYEAVVAEAADLRSRLLAIARAMTRLTLENESAFRRFLSHAVVADDPLSARGGRRVAYMTRALDETPHGLSPAQRSELVAALSALCGIETLVAMVDVARLPRERLPEVTDRLARTILDSYLGLDAD